MALHLLLSLLLFFISFSAAQLDYSLFGVDAWGMPMRINTFNYSVTELSHTSITYTKWQQSSVYVPSTNNFYVVTYDFGSSSFYLIIIDSESGNQVQQSLPFNSAVTNYQLLLDYSHTTGELIITGPCNNSLSEQCTIKMDPNSTGSWKEVSRIGISNTQIVALAAFDEVQGIEFVLFGSQSQSILVGINLVDGSIAYKIPLAEFSLKTLHYDRNTQFLYGIATQGNGANQHLLQINAKGNAINAVTTLSGYVSTVGSVSADNYQDGVFFAFMSNSSVPFPETPFQLVTINMTTGNIIQAVPACTITGCPYTLASS